MSNRRLSYISSLQLLLPQTIQLAIGSQKISCLLDLSAAFDTTDHDILITRLSSWSASSSCLFGVDGLVEEMTI